MIEQGIFKHTYTSTASDITPLYRLTPNALLMYFQDSFARLMTIHGLAAFDIVKQRRMWVITEVQMDVQPTVTFWSEDFQWNILNLDTKRLETTDFMADRLTVVPELMTASHKKVRFPKPQGVDLQMEHRATRLDLDFNFHVSNRSYVSIALLTMPEDVLASQALSSLTVHWLHETYLDDLLTCNMSHTEDGNYLHTLTNADGVVVCELMSRWQPQPHAADVSEVLDRNL